MMRTRDYFMQSAVSFAKSFVLLGKGLWYGAVRLFTGYPNITWAAITAIVIVVSVVKVGQARSERDSYDHKMVVLQQRLDSCMMKDTRYER